MAKITTTYDSTLKEKVFIVKGEEAYARTTDCVLTELFTNNGERRSDWNDSIDNMKLEFRIDVLRDVGASQVVLYDNDITLGVFPLDTNSHRIDLKYEEDLGVDNRIELGYGIEHNIYAKYMGNKQCLKSQSQSYTLSEPIPSKYRTELIFTNEYGEELTTFDFDTAPEIRLGLILNAESHLDGNTIKIYDNDELIYEGETEGGGGLPFPLHRQLPSTNISKGLHRLKAVFEGNDYLESKTATVDLSVGYEVVIEECPFYRVNGEAIDIVAKVQSFLGNPPSTEFSTRPYTVRGAINTVVDYPTEDGLLHFNDVELAFNRFIIGLETVYFDVDYVSEEKVVYPLPNTTLSISSDYSIISPNKSTYIYATLNYPFEGIGVDFNGTTEYTGKNGIARYLLMGTGSGDISITASVHESSDSIAIEDLYQYWSKRNGSLSISFTDRYGATTSQSNGWKCTPNSSGRYMSQLMSLEENNISYEFIVKGVSKLTGIGQDNNPISGIKVGDVIQAVYDVETNYVTFIVNQTTIGSFQHHGSIISFDFYFADSSGYLTIDELKVKRSE